MSRMDLNQKFPNLKPVKSAPTLMLVNGCGVTMYGKRDLDEETNTYVATWCVTLVFIPIFCLRAYRVARAPNGWQFLGREPLSALARWFNLIIVFMIVSGISLVQYNTYISTPEYKAKRRMESAREMVVHGQLANAAKIYASLAGSGTVEAANASMSLKNLLDNECRNAPLSESSGVILAAAPIARRGKFLAVTDISTRGMSLVAEKGDSDPRSAIAVLNAIRPLVIDTRPIDASKLPLLKKWAAKEPGNLEVVIPLAALFEQQNQLDDAKKLLLPVKDKLGDGEGARVLGTILGREGDYDGAYAMLWPYVKIRLDNLHASEKAAEDSYTALWDREINILKENKGPESFYNKYNTAGKDAQRTIVQEYVNSRIKDDPDYTSTQESLERDAAVVPVAMELGIVMLQRAQGQKDAAIRKTQLESTEQVFLAIRGVAEHTDEYRMSLGQVYYWLGKQEEGHKLFDEYLASKGRAHKELMQIAKNMRHLGAIPDARALAEEAYNKGTKPEEQHAAAQFRAVCAKDADDEIAWLQKSDLTNSVVKATLAKALGQKALEEGRDAEAATQYQITVDTYGAMPRSSTTLNETALACYGLFRATGEHTALEKCIDYFQQAVTLDPSDPILLFNAGTTLLDASLAEIAGSEIDLRALQHTGDFHLLGYLYQDRAGRETLTQRVKDHPGVARALSYLEKVVILSPKDARVCSTVHSIHHFTRNQAALESLESRIRAAGLETSDQLTDIKDFCAGTKDQQYRVGIEASLKRIKDRNSVVRGKGGKTLAVALDDQVKGLLMLDTYTGSVDLSTCVSLAQEAFNLAPSTRTSSSLMGTYLTQAAKELRHADPEFDAYMKKYDRSVGTSVLMAYLASEPGPYQERILKSASFQKAVRIVHDEAEIYPEGTSTFDWALLKNADASTAEKIAGYIRKDPLSPVEAAISQLLYPSGSYPAIDKYWRQQILGKPDGGKSAMKAIAALGVPMPE